MRALRICSSLCLCVLLLCCVASTAAADIPDAWHAADAPVLSPSRSFGRSADNLSSPTAIALDAVGNVLIADTLHHCVQKYSATGTPLTRWGSFGTAAGQFKLPNGIAADAQNNVYVVDWGNSRIQKFDGTGRFLLAWGSAGSANGQFSFDRAFDEPYYKSGTPKPLPTGIAVSKAGRVYVSDAGNHRVQIFDTNGIYLGDAAQKKAYSYYSDITGPLAVDTADNLTISDHPIFARKSAILSVPHPGLAEMPQSQRGLPRPTYYLMGTYGKTPKFQYREGDKNAGPQSG